MSSSAEEVALTYEEYLKIRKGSPILMHPQAAMLYPKLYAYAETLAEYNRVKAFEKGIRRLRGLARLKLKLPKAKIGASITLFKLKKPYKTVKAEEKRKGKILKLRRKLASSK